jgi:hypothetical protein
MWTGFTNRGGVDTAAYVVGSWDEIVAVANSVNYSLGCVQDGVLEVSREYYRHQDNQFPRKMDMVIPTTVGMKFTGKVEEMNNQNVAMLIGQSLNQAGNQYLYVGALQNAYYFTLHGRRARPQDGFVIEFVIWKGMQTAPFSFNSADEVVGSNLEVEGLDDAAGVYGGSSTAPLGWIYVPEKTPPSP